MRPRVFALRIRGGELQPAPRGPRWLAYGDSIAEGWIASGPSGAWPAIAARRTGLDVVNLGYAGSARGELPTAQQIAALDADVISVSHGTNCWSRIPFSAAMFREQTRAFLGLVRSGHPDTPIVVTSPILRPDAENTPNALGATLVDLRVAMEELIREMIAAGDPHLTLVEGGGLIGPDDLPDGIHPGDHGHEVLADVFGGAVARAVAYTDPSLEG
jgi:lysophospholipase L1-like esterase